MNRERQYPDTKLCSLVGCGVKHAAKGYCVNHYMMWKRRGDPLAEPLKYNTPEEAFAARTEWQGDCLIWTGSVNNSGYGSLLVSDKVIGAHVYSWQQKFGEIPDGLDIDHCVCYDKRCCNPEHLRVATRAQNATNINGTSKHNKLGEVNIYLYKTGEYAVQITKNSVRHWFGLHKTLEEAKTVRDKAREELFGEFKGNY